MAASPVPVTPAPALAPEGAAAPMGELFSSYNPGSPTDLFVPAFIKGYAPSEAAVSAWRKANRGVGWAEVEASRMPGEWRDPSASGASDQYGGGSIPYNLDYTGPGAVDPLALMAMSQGGPYNASARRNAIAARVLANTNAQQAAAAAANPYQGAL